MLKLHLLITIRYNHLTLVICSCGYHEGSVLNLSQTGTRYTHFGSLLLTTLWLQKTWWADLRLYYGAVKLITSNTSRIEPTTVAEPVALPTGLKRHLDIGILEMYRESSQDFKIELFSEIVNGWKPLTIFT